MEKAFKLPLKLAIGKFCRHLKNRSMNVKLIWESQISQSNYAGNWKILAVPKKL
jgi:hypothetical protein